MSTTLENPSVSSGGLVTVAFLKAQLDSGNDYIGIFLPMVVDSARSFSRSSFAKQELQERISAVHGLAMPQHVIATLLDRALRQGFVTRESGRYRITQKALDRPTLTESTHEINESQIRLAQALCEYGESRGLRIESSETALEILLRFLDSEQVGVLLGGRAGVSNSTAPSHQETIVIAGFIYDVVSRDKGLSGSLGRILEGLVLYHAAFLPDLSSANRKFKNLRVVFDGSLVRQALGFDGLAAQMLMVETIKLLRDTDIQCLVFDKTVQEIRRILGLFENRLGTAEGQRTLRSSAMARHFLTTRVSPGDVRQMSALLEMNIQKAGFAIATVPPRQRAYNSDEKALSEMLASPGTDHDEIEPRVAHDVDCIAGILIWRAGVRSDRLEDARAVFAADQPHVIRTVTKWWREKEREQGVEPIVNIRAIANLAWLKRPAVSASFKLCEVVSLCCTALAPSREVWKHFLRHLEELQARNSLTNDEVTAIIISATSDRLLREAEAADGEDIDSVTLDEIVERVKNEYAAEAKQIVVSAEAKHKEELAQAQLQRDSALIQAAKADERRNARRTRARERADRWAKRLIGTLRFMANILLAFGAADIILSDLVEGKLIDSKKVLVLVAITFFYLFEFFVLKRDVAHGLEKLSQKLSDAFYSWLDPEGKYDDI